jgi:hypothetical protein
LLIELNVVNTLLMAMAKVGKLILKRYADVGMEQQVDLSSAFLTNWRSSRREEAADLHTTEAENDLTRYNRG